MTPKPTVRDIARDITTCRNVDEIHARLKTLINTIHLETRALRMDSELATGAFAAGYNAALDDVGKMLARVGV